MNFIAVKSHPLHTNSSLGSRALSALSAIPGVQEARLVEDEDQRVLLSYSFDPALPPFDRIDEHLLTYGLARDYSGE